MFLSLLGTCQHHPGSWAPPLLRLFSAVSSSVSCLSAVECDIQHAGSIGILQVLTLVAILSFTHLAGPPEGSLWTGGIMPAGLHMTRQEVQAGSGKQGKTRAG